jgi:HEAT repeat protein
MQTSWLLVLFTLGIESAAAQVPAPTPPARPVPPARKPSVTHPPATPLAPHAQWDFMYEPHFSLAPMPEWHFDLMPPMPEFPRDFEFPPEPLLPVLPALPPFEAQLPHEPLLPAPFAEVPWHLESPQGSGGNLSRVRPDQGTPEDSLFRAAREALGRGEYARASTLFASFEQRFPRSRVAPTAMYWRAFALYRSGASDELRAALEALKAQQERYPEAAADPDAATLRTRLYAALAARGDAQAATALRAANASGVSCDREEMEVRAEALNALAQLDAPEARPTLKRVLARRDECSATLRRRAVYILGRSGTEESAADLVEVAKNDPDAGVRNDAIMFIGRSAGTASVKVLEQLFNESSDERTRAAALSALRSKGGPEAKRALRAIIEKAEVPERVRAEAIQQLGRSSDKEGEWVTIAGRRTPAPPTAGDEEDAAFLRGLYTKTDSRTVKSAIVSAVARIGGSTNEQWLLGIAKNRNEETSLRREALSRIKTSSLSIEELGKLFDALPERELRYAVVNQLASRDDPAAVDKLIEIARSGTDPQVRRQAISALARKNDPRTTKLLLELVEKP